MTFLNDLEEYIGDEQVSSIVIGEMGWDHYNEVGKEISSDLKGFLLNWDEARPLLNYEYDSSYGVPECHSVYIWTKSRVIFVAQYDGSTSITSVPRDPIAVIPEMPGG